jgi:hypothetical protein
LETPVQLVSQSRVQERRDKLLGGLQREGWREVEKEGRRQGGRERERWREREREGERQRESTPDIYRGFLSHFVLSNNKYM